MRKTLLIAAVCSILFTTSCSSPPMPESTTMPTATPFPGNDFIKSIYQSYKSYFTLLDTPLSISGNVKNHKDTNIVEMSMDDYTLNFYKFNPDDTNVLNKWSIEFNLDDTDKLKDLFAATFLVTDNECTLDGARERAQKLANSFSNTSLSEFFDSGDYCIYTLATYNTIFRKNDYYLFVVDNQIFNVMPEEQKSEYLLSDYETSVNAIMNKGIKVYFTGIVKTLTLDSARSNGETFIAVDNAGNEYKITTSYYSVPHIFDVNEKYIFYGTVSGDDTISPAEIDLDYYEIVK